MALDWNCGVEGRGESKKPTLSVRVAAANILTFCLCHAVAMVALKNSSSSLPCQPYSLLFNTFRPCWAPAPQYGYVQVLRRKHKVLGFFNNSYICANAVHSLIFCFNTELSHIYVPGGAYPFLQHFILFVFRYNLKIFKILAPA